MKRSLNHQLGTIFFVALLSAQLAFADEPSGFFGLEFGEPLSSTVVIENGDPEFAPAVSNLTPSEQALARGKWLEALFGDPSALPDKVRKSLKKELKGHKIFVPVKPPEPNHHFEDYVALVTPESGRLAAIWTYGQFEPCTPTIRTMADFLLEKYPSLKSTMPEAQKSDIDYVSLHSDNIRISLMCDHATFVNKALEKKTEAEMQNLFRRVAEGLINFDKSGL